jgi:hypothetical protein
VRRQQLSLWRLALLRASRSGATRASVAGRTTEKWLDGGQYTLKVILGSGPTTATHPNRAKGLRIRGSPFGSVRHPAVPFSPAAACRSGTRVQGTLASVRILGQIQESKDSNTEKQARTTESTEIGIMTLRVGARLPTARSAPILFCSVNSVVLACFLRVETLTFCASNAVREEVCMLKDRVRGRQRGTTPIMRTAGEPGR